MKVKKFCFISAIIVGIFCTSVFGKTGSPGRGGRRPIIRVNPALAKIKELNVVIVPPHTDWGTTDLFWEQLRSGVEQKLIKSDGRLANLINRGLRGDSLNGVELKIGINILRPANSQQYMLYIQTSLVISVLAERDPPLVLQADAWTTGATIQTPPQNELAAISNLVLQQTEAFISAWLAANPQSVQAADANDVKVITPRKPAKPPARQTTVEYKYVASKNSKVFHKSVCSSAKRIKPENLVSYNSRAQAIEAGKRPCKRCKP